MIIYITLTKSVRINMELYKPPSWNYQQANTDNHKTRTRWGGTPLLLVHVYIFATNVATVKTDLTVAT